MPFKSYVRMLTLALLLVLTGRQAWSQATETTAPAHPTITADNVAELQSVALLDVSTLSEPVTLASGWFTLSPDGMHFAAVTRQNAVAIFSQTELVEHYSIIRGDEPATVLDARFSADGTQLASLHSDGTDFVIVLHTLATDTTPSDTLEIEVPPRIDGKSMGIPVRVWIGEGSQNEDAETASENGITVSLWLETMPADGGRNYQVIRLPLDADGQLVSDAVTAILSAPEQDTDAYVRIGRIPAPLAVTATQDGLVKLWDLETGSPRYTVQVDDVPVFGRVNENGGEQLAWRDGSSLGLNVLDFVSGANIRVTDLEGDYIQALMITPSGDVVLAVHIGQQNNVVAWVVDSGERIELGDYHACTGVPDMVQLSQDGTTLVIGCDASFEIWQVRE